MVFSFSDYLKFKHDKSYCPRYYSEDKIKSIAINYLEDIRYDATTCYEYLNPELIDFLIEHRGELESRIGTKEGRLNYFFNILRVIKLINLDGYYVTNYYSVANSRQYVENNISIQLFKRELRQILAYSLYYDIDIKNCHPTLLTHILESNKWECGGSLKRYRDHREICIKELIELNPKLKREDIKEYLIAIMNGGFSYCSKFKKQNDFLINFVQECKDACKIICDENKEVYDESYTQVQELNDNGHYDKRDTGYRLNEAKIKDKASRRTVSYFMTELENEILEFMIKFFRERNFFQHIVIKLFDGFQIPSTHSLTEIENSLPELQNEIKDKFKIKIFLKVKPFTDCLHLIRKMPKHLIKHKENHKHLAKLVKDCTFEAHRFVLLNKLINYDINVNLKTRKKYIDPYDEHIENNDTVFVKSQMGSGKTVSLYSFLNKYRKKYSSLDSVTNKMVEGKTIIFISFRRSLERKYLEDLDGFENYEDIRSRYINPKDHPRLVIQINSLHRLLGTYDFVVLDEVSYVFDTLISYCENKVRIYNILRYLLEACDKLVCMDAYMTKRDINYIKTLRPNRRNFVILNEVSGFRGYVNFYERNVFLSNLNDDLLRGKKVIFASNSKSYLETYVVPLLEDIGVKYLLITNTSEYIDPKTWNQYQIVMYTPTIVAGVSFDEHYFNKRYGYFSNNSSPANMCCQQLFRVRHTTDPDIHMLIHQFGKNSNPVEIKDVIKYIHKYINLEDNVLGKHVTDCLKSGFVDFSIIEKRFKQDEYSKLLYDYIIKINKSKNNIKSQLLKFLRIQGYMGCDVRTEFDEDLKDFNDHLWEVTVEYNQLKKKELFKLYKTLHIPDEKEYNDIKHQNRKSIEDKIQLDLFSLRDMGIYLDSVEVKNLEPIVNNIKNFKFDHLVDKSEKILNHNEKSEEKIDPVELCLDHILYHSKYNKTKYIKKTGIGTELYKYTDDPLIYPHFTYTDTEFRGRHERDFYAHKQATRDYWIKCYHALKLIEIIGFESNSDFTTELDKLNAVLLKEIHDYIILNWNDFTLLFGISRKLKKYDKFEKNNNILKCLNSKIKIINRRIVKSTRGKQKKIYYTLSKLVEF